MSHVYAYGVQCPEAKGIIHLGATSCYVGDNTDILVMREALEVVRRKLLNVMALLAEFADEYKAMPALAYTCLLYTSASVSAATHFSPLGTTSSARAVPA